ncbi:hypothetical protein BLNAU_2525 [Blattamonas nauphoetae]|uniref:Uncharacterized protein n=1 Tax=Blattamonas nauphoetae TaxID=2049346 RepID=A0ABQ9YG13_9EUKA|nr:hypothetical protein BLNAU_2525 [Blattamonas nauphoetae]
MTLVLVFSCVTSIIRHYMDDSSFHLGYLTFLSNSVMYLTVSTSLFTNFYRLIRIYFDASLDRSYKKRLGMLVSMVGIVFSIQTIRFGYALLKVMKLNVLHNGIEMKRMECATNDISNSKSCVAFSWYYSLLHLFFDFLPTGLLLVTFNLLNSQGSAKRKTRPKKYLDTHSDASKSPTSAHRSGGGVDTPQTSINSVHPYPKNKPRKPARKRPQRRAIRYDTVPDIEEDFVMVP